MAFPTIATVIDDFNRADEDPVNTDWTIPLFTGDGNLRVISNQLARDAGFGSAYWDTETFGPDCECYITLPNLGDVGNTAGLFVRMGGLDGTPTGYRLRIQNNAGQRTMMIRRQNGDGTETNLTAETNITLAAGDKVGIECIGSAIKGYSNNGGTWTERVSGTDATYNTAGNFGIGIQDTAWRLDDFSGGTIVSGVQFDFGMIGRGSA